ncbi:hypothetical protein MKW92_033986 [Papaver armeniacum]|nr:hypothetical protein MKW92_033986 [Papaver armeniacum]
MEQAKKDIDLWFCSIDFDVTIDFGKAVRQNKKVVFVLPCGDIYSPLREVKDIWKLDASYEIKQCVLLIKPLAFQERFVGEILDAIEANCTGVRGLKLVEKAKHPSKAWPADSVSYGDVHGVAVVVYNLKSSFKIVPGDSNIKNINFRNKVFEISS